MKMVVEEEGVPGQGELCGVSRVFGFISGEMPLEVIT